MDTDLFVSSSARPMLIFPTVVTLILLICVGTPFSRGAPRTVTAAKQNVRVTPFTLETQTHIYDAPASSQRLSRQIIARREDGATASLAYRSKDEPDAAHAQMRIITYPDGRRVDVYDRSHAVTRWPADPKHYAFQKKLIFAPPRNCVEPPGEYFAGNSSLGGVKVAIVKEFPKDSSGTTWWRAPALGCETLQTSYTQVQADGSFHLVRETKFIRIKLGTPNPALFAVPTSYVSLKPSEALREWAKRAGHKWDAQLQAQAEREDARLARLEQAAKSEN